MHRQLRELDRWYDEQQRPASRGGDGLRRFLVGGTTVVVAVLATVHVLGTQGIVLSLDGLSRRVGPGPVEPATGDGVYVFIAHQPGRPDVPVGYDPCTPIRVEVNTKYAPPDADGILADALVAVTRATGIKFVQAGETERLPQPRAVPRAGTAPTVLVAWTTPKVVPRLAGSTVGLGGSTWSAFDTGPRRYAAGTVSLDSPWFWRLATRPGGEAIARSVVMHEFGHVLGLHHVDDPRELMNEKNVGLTTWGPGDRRGLAILGRLPCRG